MTNEKAIQLILEKSKGGTNAESLAAQYALDDIVSNDIATWINSDVSDYLMQFPDVANELVIELIDTTDISKLQLATALTEVSESMYHYVKFHEILTSYEMALSER